MLSNTKKKMIEVAFSQGRIAAEDGWERISPYTKHFCEKYWYAGYDSFIPKTGLCNG